MLGGNWALVIGLGILAVVQSAAFAQEASGSPDQDWPPVARETRPWTRWWWLGSAVDRENITSLLQTYHKAGLGGVEITPIYGVQGQEARELSYLSPGWISALQHTIREAGTLDMGVDMPTGTGWPFGGPQVTDEDALDKLLVERSSVAGGAAFELAPGRSKPEALVAVSDRGVTVSLLDHIDANGGLKWPTPAGQFWTVYKVSIQWSGRDVKRAAPGGAGKCINPFSKPSLTHYLARFDTALAGFPPGALRCEFHDSFEYAADWMPSFFDEFLKRRQYDLRDHLPAFVNSADPDHARVRTDYRETIGELLLEDFTRPWTAWAHGKGSLTRNQAHGSPGNLIDLYAAVDIPETEVFRSIGDPRITKFASSAAHLMGRRLASSESCTWQSEHFTETLGTSKRTLDRLMAAGINHIFYHGTAYSPADAAWPGWLFYASTHFEPNNPTWHDFPALNAYVTRCQSVLQSGSADNDVLLYWPLHDLWQNQPRVFGLTIEGAWLESEPIGATAQVLWDHGYAYDYISDRILSACRVRAGSVATAGGSYRVVLVPPCGFMPVDTLKNLLRLARNGAKVLFEGGLPRDVPGLGRREERLAQMRSVIGRLDFKPGRSDVRRAQIGRGAVLVGPSATSLLESAGVRREAICDHHGAMVVRRRMAAGHAYFIVNQGAEPLDGWYPLGATAASAVLMDPMTGRTGIAAIRQSSASGAEPGPLVYLQIPRDGSIIVRTLASRRVAGAPWDYYEPAAPAQPLQGVWTVRFVEGGPVLPRAYSAPEPTSWTASADPETQRFAGTARYSVTFDAPRDPFGEWALDLGDVRESAHVTLNGQDLGTLLLAPWVIRLNHLKPTGNLLEVDVTSVAANRVRDMDRRHVPWRIFKEINFVNINYKPFDASNWPIRECGLLGPVSLTPLRRLEPSAR